MLTTALLSLALTSPAGHLAPTVPAPAALRTVLSSSLAQDGSGRFSMGCNKPKCQARKDIPIMLANLGGPPLANSHRDCLSWLEMMSDPEAGVVESDGREVGATATLALVLLGTGSSTTGGIGTWALKDCVRALRGWQDSESGAIGDPQRDEYELEQALALLALSEAYYSDERPVHQEAATKAAKALLAARADDGLWHAGDAEGAPVDPLVTSLAGYALFVARSSGLEVPDEAFEPVLGWTKQVADEAAGEGEELGREQALRFACALSARLFTAEALQRPLTADESVVHLSEVVAAQVPPAPEAGAEWTAPPRLREGDFAFFAGLGLYQVDNEAWGRFAHWFAVMNQADAEKREPIEKNDGRRRGVMKLLGFPAGDTGSLPGGQLGTTAWRILALQNGVREPNLSVLVE